MRRGSINSILEGLNSVSESKLDFVDELILIDDTLKVQDKVSGFLTDKYKKSFVDIGDFYVQVDIETYDNDDWNLENIADEMYIDFYFDDLKVKDQKKIIQSIVKEIKLIKDYKVSYDNKNDCYGVEIKNNQDILDVFNNLDKLGCKMNNRLYHVVDGDELRSELAERDRQDYLDKQELISQYYRDRM